MLVVRKQNATDAGASLPPLQLVEIPADRALESEGQGNVTKVMATQIQRIKSSRTIAIGKRTAAIDPGHRIDLPVSFPAPSGRPEESAHMNSCN
jgi:hypothetical protein